MDLEFLLGERVGLFILFFVIIIAFLVIDLGIFNKGAKKITIKAASLQTIFWIAISVAFGFVIYFFGGGKEPMLEYFSAYVTEKALSMDNIFVILLVLKYFSVEEKYYHKILFWGIIGVLILRGIFIFVGVVLVAKVHWILMLFGGFLVFSGIKLFFEEGEEEYNPDDSFFARHIIKRFKVSQGNHGASFFVTENGKTLPTVLFLVLVIIEVTDLIFAVDSIPAAFAITDSRFILYTSNIFAVLGLRAMFFLLAGVMNKFYLLQKGVSFILIFIGAKMLLEFVDIHLSTMLSFLVIVVTLFLSAFLSILIPKKQEIE